MKKNINLFIALFICLTPSLVFAVDFKGLVLNLINQLRILPYVIFFGAFVYFLYNVMSYIQANDPKQIQEASKMITYSLIGLFVMTSVWGLVRFIMNTVDIDDSTSSIPIPTIPIPSGR